VFDVIGKGILAEVWVAKYAHLAAKKAGPINV
jgi:hypothetical protein